MSDTSYSVSEASRILEVQSHVLRFWEEELLLPIGRNKMGHRYYTRYDIQTLMGIKELKRKGFSLKEIKELIPFFYRTNTNQTVPAASPVKEEKTQKSIAEKRAETAARKKKSGRAPKQPPQHVEKERKKETQVPEEFMEILDKLVKERMRTLHTGEERYKRLDERIRTCQKSRKEVAAAMERERRENKKRFRKKQ